MKREHINWKHARLKVTKGGVGGRDTRVLWEQCGVAQIAPKPCPLQQHREVPDRGGGRDGKGMVWMGQGLITKTEARKGLRLSPTMQMETVPY